MPVMDGLKATRKIKGFCLLWFTLYSSPQLEWESKQAGADIALPKAEGSTLPTRSHTFPSARPLMHSSTSTNCKKTRMLTGLSSKGEVANEYNLDGHEARLNDCHTP
jgi:hypothetical protein